ncbi:MAG: ABC transporter substrate-binding protein [Chloroflexota bacterium]
MKATAPFVGALALALLTAACGAGTAPASSPPSPVATAAAKPSAPPLSASASAQPASASAKPAALAAASASAAAKPGATPVRLGLLPSVASAPIYANLEAGAFANSGLDVSITPFTDTVQIMVSIAGGQLDMGQVTLGAAALNAFNRGTDLKIVSSANQDPPEHGSLAPVLVRTDLIDSGQVKSAKDLKGRKVAINGKGTILEYSIGKYMLDNGMQPSDVEIAILPLPDQVTALGNKAIDAALTLQPLATQAIQKGVAKILTDSATPNAQLGMITANTKWAESHHDALVSFMVDHVRMIRRLSDGAVKKDDAALAAIQKWVKTDPEIVRSAPDPFWPKDGRINRKSLADEQQYFLDQKATNYTTAIPIDRMVDETYLEEALKKLGS